MKSTIPRQIRCDLCKHHVHPDLIVRYRSIQGTDFHVCLDCVSRIGPTLVKIELNRKYTRKIDLAELNGTWFQLQKSGCRDTSSSTYSTAGDFTVSQSQ